MSNDGAVGKIEQQEWLKPAEEGLQKFVHKAFGFRAGRHVKNFLHGTWIGHPHLGGPLSEGKLDGYVIQCPWHGSRFSIRDGHVVDGPAVHPQPCLEA